MATPATTPAIATAKRAVQQILTENVLSLSETRDEFESTLRYRPEKSTITRWMHQGVGGVKLAHIRLGNQLFTSRERITAFIEERTAAK